MAAAPLRLLARPALALALLLLLAAAHSSAAGAPGPGGEAQDGDGGGGGAPWVTVTPSMDCSRFVGIDYDRNYTLKLVVEGLFFAVFVAASVQLARIWRADPVKRLTPQKLFHALVMAAFLVRLACVPLPVSVYDGMNPFERFVALTLPGVIFFSAYSLLFFYWLAVYHRAVRLLSQGFQRSLAKVYAGGTALALVGMLGIAAYLELSHAPYSRIQHVSVIFVATLSFGVVLAAAFFGLRAYVRLRAYPVVSQNGRTLMRKVGAVLAVCCTAFAIKSPSLVYLQVRVCERQMVSYEKFQMLECLYLLVCDILPTVMLLYLVRRPPSSVRSAKGGDGAAAPFRAEPSADAVPVSTNSRAHVDQLDPLYLPFSFGSGGGAGGAGGGGGPADSASVTPARSPANVPDAAAGGWLPVPGLDAGDDLSEASDGSDAGAMVSVMTPPRGVSALGRLSPSPGLAVPHDSGDSADDAEDFGHFRAGSIPRSASGHGGNTPQFIL